MERVTLQSWPSGIALEQGCHVALSPSRQLLALAYPNGEVSLLRLQGPESGPSVLLIPARTDALDANLAASLVWAPPADSHDLLLSPSRDTTFLELLIISDSRGLTITGITAPAADVTSDAIPAAQPRVSTADTDPVVTRLSFLSDSPDSPWFRCLIPSDSATFQTLTYFKPDNENAKWESDLVSDSGDSLFALCSRPYPHPGGGQIPSDPALAETKIVVANVLQDSIHFRPPITVPSQALSVRIRQNKVFVLVPNGTLTIFSADSGQPLTAFQVAPAPHGQEFSTFAISSDARILAAVTRDGRLVRFIHLHSHGNTRGSSLTLNLTPPTSTTAAVTGGTRSLAQSGFSSRQRGPHIGSFTLHSHPDSGDKKLIRDEFLPSTPRPPPLHLLFSPDPEAAGGALGLVYGDGGGVVAVGWAGLALGSRQEWQRVEVGDEGLVIVFEAQGCLHAITSHKFQALLPPRHLAAGPESREGVRGLVSCQLAALDLHRGPAGDAADLQEAGMERQLALMQRGLLSEVPEDVRRLQQLNGWSLPALLLCQLDVALNLSQSLTAVQMALEAIENATLPAPLALEALRKVIFGSLKGVTSGEDTEQTYAIRMLEVASRFGTQAIRCQVAPLRDASSGQVALRGGVRSGRAYAHLADVAHHLETIRQLLKLLKRRGGGGGGGGGTDQRSGRRADSGNGLEGSLWWVE